MKRICVVFFALLMLLSGCTKNASYKENEMRVFIPSTGKSDAILIKSCGYAVLNDAAYSDTSADLQNYLKSSGVEQIDLLILSHFDKDHIGGAADILRNFDVKMVVMPDYYSGSEFWLDMIEALDECDAERIIINSPEDFTFGEMKVHIDSPQLSKYEDENNYSLITEVSFGETRLLLTGDALDERLGEYLEKLSDEAHFDMIKLPHHGDSFPSLQKLVKLTAPKYAVITCDNTRSTVEEKVLKTLSKSETTVFFTDEGAVSFISDGSSIFPVNS